MSRSTDITAWLETRRVHITDAPPPVGADHALAVLRSVVARVRHPVPGCPPPHGILIGGPTGTGKTSLARHLASLLGDIPAYDLPADAEPDRLRAALAHLAAAPRSVVFLPEIDAVGIDRSMSRDARRTAALCALLECIDGLVAGPPDAGPILVATCNRPEVLDPALTRPGRLSVHISLDLPNEPARAAIIAHYLSPLPVAEGVDVRPLALLARGASGAHLRQAVEEAYGRALDRAGPGTPIKQSDLMAALRRGSRVDAQDPPELVAARLERVAVHEAGHAVVAARLGLTINAVRLGETGHDGFTDLGSEGRSRTDADVHASAIIGMAGMSAERLVFPETGGSLGSRDDVRQATALLIARIEAGLDPSFPPVARTAYNPYGPSPLDEAMAQHVSGLLVEARERAETILAGELDTVRRLARRFIDDPVIAGDALQSALIDAGVMPAIPAATEGVD